MSLRKRTTYQHGNLRATLIEGALALVEERGVRDFSLAEAARRAGVSGGAPYRHFRDRNELLAAIAAQAYAELGERMRAAANETHDAVEQIGAMAGAYVEFARDERAAFEVLFDGGLSKSDYPELSAAGDEATAEMIDASKRIVGDDQARAEKFAVTLWATSHGFAMLMLERALAQRDIDDAGVVAMASSAGRNLARAARARSLEPARA
jgi:AcrR family transcriptional regulator